MCDCRFNSRMCYEMGHSSVLTATAVAKGLSPLRVLLTHAAFVEQCRILKRVQLHASFTHHTVNAVTMTNALFLRKTGSTFGTVKQVF